MKLRFMILATLLCVSFESFARTVTDPEIKDYQDAVLAILKPLDATKCNNKWNTEFLIKYSQSLEVSGGEQPLLVFSYSDDSNKGLYQTVITTDASFKRITRLQILEFAKGRTNSGDLLNPVMKEGYLPLPNGINECRL